MNIQRLGILVMALSTFFFMMTPWDKTADQNFLVWAGAVGFLIYGVALMWKYANLQAVQEYMEENLEDPELVDDVRFEFYLSQKTWARVRFTWVTRITLGLVVGLWVFG